MATLVLSIGGSILLTGEDDVDFIRNLAEMIKDVREENRLCIVVGGGSLARKYIGIGREFGMDETYLDQIGIEATRLNAMLLISAIKEGVNHYPFDDIDEALRNIDDYNPVIMGGTVPGQTTDAVAAFMAERLAADLFINATAVDGVYDEDPKKNPDAKRFETLGFKQLNDIVGESLGQAGTNIVIDPVAARAIAEAEVTTYVLDGRDLGNFRRAINGEEFRGTIIGD
jgi:uridylate kinase